jgi:hypothetical protein
MPGTRLDITSVGAAALPNVRFDPDSGHQQKQSSCPLSATSGRSALQQTILLDHLVSTSKQLQRHRYAKRAGGLHIDDQEQLCSLRHRQIGWFLAFENSACVDPERTVSVHKFRNLLGRQTIQTLEIGRLRALSDGASERLAVRSDY